MPVSPAHPRTTRPPTQPLSVASCSGPWLGIDPDSTILTESRLMKVRCLHTASAWLAHLHLPLSRVLTGWRPPSTARPVARPARQALFPLPSSLLCLCASVSSHMQTLLLLLCARVCRVCTQPALHVDHAPQASCVQPAWGLRTRTLLPGAPCQALASQCTGLRAERPARPRSCLLSQLASVVMCPLGSGLA